MDNARKEALVTTVDLKTGILGKAKTYYDKTLYSKHPDSGAQIEGVKIPNWHSVKAKLLDVAVKFPYIDFIAWDVVITKDGFSVIEGQCFTSLDLFQMWGVNAGV
ncbi:MAG: sugar-transfer associated ATP-grasp domain-containing protein [Dethiobacteraceae bacterium]